MNSQIYCLPQKYGWNAMYCTSGARGDTTDRNKETEVRRPYFTVQFHGPPAEEEAIATFHRQYPRFASTTSPTDQEAINAIYQSEYGFKYGPEFTAPFHKPPPPTSFEPRADPVANRPPMNPPISSLRPLAREVNDPERGAYEWRELVPKPGMYMWQAPRKTPVNGEPGVRSTFLPVRLRHHDPCYEKERWDKIRELDRRDGLSYNFRTNMPGYTGWRSSTTDLTSCVERGVSRSNLAMATTTRAYHREFPPAQYKLPGLDATSRMVTMAQQ